MRIACSAATTGRGNNRRITISYFCWLSDHRLPQAISHKGCVIFTHGYVHLASSFYKCEYGGDLRSWNRHHSVGSFHRVALSHYVSYYDAPAAQSQLWYHYTRPWAVSLSVLSEVIHCCFTTSFFADMFHFEKIRSVQPLQVVRFSLLHTWDL